MISIPPFVSVCLGILILSGIAGCNQAPSEESSGIQRNSNGQVSAIPTKKVNFYAASRFAEQASFGPSPDLVEEISQLGLESWLDKQLAMPPKINQVPADIINFNLDNREDVERTRPYAGNDFWMGIVSEPDQVRRRVAWAIFQYIPILDDNFPYGRADYFNLMLRNAFGNYSTILREVTVHPMMGKTLNNDQNRPATSACLGCAPNENYARELLQLFSVGVVQLNIDGTVIRDANGKALETYTQNDVEQLARALTGWRFDNSDGTLPNSNWLGIGRPMVPEKQAILHDSGSKVIMGTTLKAGMNAQQELDAVIDLLMRHPNTAPFVSLRLIQHLVTSNPSPAYIGRVAKVFRDNGSGVSGDLKAVVRTILLDPEARRGDEINADTNNFGKIREPINWYAAVLRGLNCKTPAYDMGSGYLRAPSPYTQDKDNIPSIFSFYQAADRAPGSNLLAPEQQLLSTIEFNYRFGNLSWLFLNSPTSASNRTNSGCELDQLTKAFSQSPNEFVNFIGKRWFRNAIPNALRSQIISIMEAENSTWQSPEEGALTMLQFALTTPHFGAIQ